MASTITTVTTTTTITTTSTPWSGEEIKEILKQSLSEGLPSELPPAPLEITQLQRDPQVPHAPVQDIRRILKTDEEIRLAIKNALRYFPVEWHETLSQDFLLELKHYGHIYMYRFRPTNFPMRAYPIDYYLSFCKSKQAAAIMLMIMNNLDPAVAQYPHELVTYGGNGSVLSNWIQFRLTMHYLSQMNDEQTLVMYSGHPHGLFPSLNQDSPRVVVSNGLVVPNYSSREDYARGYALGNLQYGQMTAGSYCYIGPQGIVHGTTITVLNAGRKYLSKSVEEEGMKGKVFVTSGL